MGDQHGVGGKARASAEDRGQQADESRQRQTAGGDIAEVACGQAIGAGRAFQQDDQELKGAQTQQKMQSNQNRLSYAAQATSNQNKPKRHGGERKHEER